MELTKLIDTAMRGGDSKVIAESEELVEKAFDYLKEHDEQYYHCLVREMHEIVNGPHYDEVFAEEDVAKLRYTDAAGNEHKGPHWTKAQITSATSAFDFPKGTTDCDKYVAFNAAYADFSKKFTEAQILDIAYLFFFKDEDWKGSGKVWSYMGSNR
jgi:hypothetical protein